MPDVIQVNVTVIETPIQVAVGGVVLGGGTGGGATTFVDLTDKATADLPAINGPLASALAALSAQLSGKAPSSGISPSAISGTAVITTDPRLADARTPTSHTHPATAIADSTETGRSLLTAATQFDARTTGLGSGPAGDALFQAASVAAANTILADNIATKAADFTLAEADAGTYMRLTKTGSTQTITLPTSGISTGAEFQFYRATTQSLAFSGGTVNGSSNLNSVPQNGAFALKHLGSGTYDFI